MNNEKVMGQVYKFGDLSIGETFFLPRMEECLQGYHQKIDERKAKVVLGVKETVNSGVEFKISPKHSVKYFYYRIPARL